MQVPNGKSTGVRVSFAWGDDSSLDVHVEGVPGSSQEAAPAAAQQAARHDPPPTQVACAAWRVHEDVLDQLVARWPDTCIID